MKLIAFPSADKKAGFFTMVNLAKDRPMNIEAHNHDIECLEMDPNGTCIASASKKGTIIRVFRVKDGSVLQEFRRGIDNAKIMSLCFDMTGQMLAVSSDSGTIHVYMIPCEDSDRDSVSTSGANTVDLRNKKSRFSFFKKAIKYFDSEWSSLQLKVDEKIVFVNFNAESSDILVYKSTGKFWRHEMMSKDSSANAKKKYELTEPIRLLKQG